MAQIDKSHWQTMSCVSAALALPATSHELQIKLEIELATLGAIYH